MNNNYNNPSFKKLLDYLQEQSWQLELIISGFAIFGLFSIQEPLAIGAQQAQNEQQIYQAVIYSVLFIACSILLFNLLLHVVLRGLWIGALGLRYVSGEIEFDELKYGNKFKTYLKKKIVSFDRYIGNLENYCSVLFAISFLLIFYVISLTTTILYLVLFINYIIDNDSLPSFISKYLGIPILIFFVLGMLFTFIDFITLGLLKRNKWVAKIYFPFYWLFSYVTLSFLYRPLIYNFLDNTFGKRLLYILLPLYLVIVFIYGLEYKNSNYLDKNLNSSSFYANKENYEDMLLNDEDFPGKVLIPSKIITTNYLKIFIPYTESIENKIFGYNATLKPEKDRKGIVSSNISFTTNWSDKITSRRQKDSLRKYYLKTFNEMYSFKIDTINRHSKFLITTDKKNRLGFETYLKLDSLKEGQHILKLIRKRKEKNDTIRLVDETIPFWFFKE